MQTLCPSFCIPYREVTKSRSDFPISELSPPQCLLANVVRPKDGSEISFVEVPRHHTCLESSREGISPARLRHSTVQVRQIANVFYQASPETLLTSDNGYHCELVPTNTTSTAAYVAVAASVSALLALITSDMAAAKSVTATLTVTRLFV